MKNKFLKISYILFIIVFLTSCESQKLIDYNLEVIETEEEQTTEFSFKKDIKQVEDTPIISTKKIRDRELNQKIKDIIKNRTRKAVKAKGVYLPAYVAGKDEKFDPIFESIKNTKINTIVVDIKDEIGRITIDTDAAIVKELRTQEKQIKDIKSFIDRCHRNNIYVVARITTFIDKFATVQDKTDMAIRRKDGKLYKDNMGYYWLNPYSEKTRQYIKEIAFSAADYGFDEIQMDYFRFSTDSGMRSVVFSEEMTKGKTKIEVLTDLAQELYVGLIEKNVYFSIDVYGSIINSYKDQNNIGQDYTNLIKYCDYICPMIYPSHYANKTFGIDVPDMEPYKTITSAVKTSISSIQNTYDPSCHYGEVRPWLQGFTANYLQNYILYTEDEYKAQIKAVEDSGYEEWIFWQGGGVYKWDAFVDE